MVFPCGTNTDCIDLVTERFQNNLDIYNAHSNRDYKLSMSMGATYHDPEHPRSVDELLDHADKLMYEQKEAKRHHRK